MSRCVRLWNIPLTLDSQRSNVEGGCDTIRFFHNVSLWEKAFLDASLLRDDVIVKAWCC